MAEIDIINELKKINAKIDAFIPVEYLEEIDIQAANDKKSKEEAIKIKKND